MERIKRRKAAYLIGGALLIGAACAVVHRALRFDIDFDPWSDESLVW